MRKPRVPWDKLPYWVECVTMNSDGIWLCHSTTRLRPLMYCFYPDNGENYHEQTVQRDLIEKFAGRWQDSMIIRPP